MRKKNMLYIFGSLPATGKSELSTYLAEKLSAVYLRIDSIEQSLKNNGIEDVEGMGYEIVYKIAADNLKLGVSVVADSVNPLPVTREAWRHTAEQAGCPFCEIVIICSDKREHKKRVEERIADIDGLRLPVWSDVLNRDYKPWKKNRIIIDTSGKSIAKSQLELSEAIRGTS